MTTISGVIFQVTPVFFVSCYYDKIYYRRKMAENTGETSLIALTPLGAGDLIDRAVRLYRQNFWTFVWIAAPPIISGLLIFHVG